MGRRTGGGQSLNSRDRAEKRTFQRQLSSPFSAAAAAAFAGNGCDPPRPPPSRRLFDLGPASHDFGRLWSVLPESASDYGINLRSAATTVCCSLRARVADETAAAAATGRRRQGVGVALRDQLLDDKTRLQVINRTYLPARSRSCSASCNKVTASVVRNKCNQPTAKMHSRFYLFPEWLRQ